MGAIAGLLFSYQSSPVLAQQMVYQQTAAQCNALGGRIITWTNTAGRGPNVGECFVAAAPSRTIVPVRPYAPPPSPGQVGAAAGSALQLLEGLSGLIQSMPEPPAAEPDVLEPSEPATTYPSTPAPSIHILPPRSQRPTVSPSVDPRQRLAEDAREKFAAGDRSKKSCDAEALYSLAFQKYRQAGDPKGAQRAYLNAKEANDRCQGHSARKIAAGSYSDGKKDLWQGCLIVSVSRKQGPPCMGSPLRLYRTDVRANKVQGCPSDFEIEYIEPDTGTLSTWWVFRASDYIQTCGSGPKALRIRPQ
jgi:hypothetical protein